MSTDNSQDTPKSPAIHQSFVFAGRLRIAQAVRSSRKDRTETIENPIGFVRSVFDWARNLFAVQ